MADCYVFFVFGNQVHQGECASYQNINQLHLCVLCGHVYELIKMVPQLKSDLIDEWGRPDKLHFSCNAHGMLMARDWILTNYPKMETWINDQSESQFWVCSAHIDLEKFIRRYATKNDKEQPEQHPEINVNVSAETPANTWASLIGTFIMAGIPIAIGLYLISRSFDAGFLGPIQALFGAGIALVGCLVGIRGLMSIVQK